MAGPAPDQGPRRRPGGEGTAPGEGSGRKAGEKAGDRFYKIGEVCAMTDTQPYVLRFWESEFPQLAPRKSRSGQRLYQKRDVDLVLRIRKLLYDEEYTIAGARRQLEELGFESPTGEEASAKRETAADESAEKPRSPRAGLDRLRKELMAIRKLLQS